jgi:cell division septum initiation protein DivIVA
MAAMGTRMPGFRRKVMVEIDQLERLIVMAEQADRSVPANIQESDEILKQKDSIISQAYLEAQRIKGVAEQQASSLTKSAEVEFNSRVSENEVLKEAGDQAEQMREKARQEANQIIDDAQRRAQRFMGESDIAAAMRREGADQYAREVLFSLESHLADVLGQVRRGIDSLRVDNRGQTASPSYAPQGSHGQEIHV